MVIANESDRWFPRLKMENRAASWREHDVPDDFVFERSSRIVDRRCDPFRREVRVGTPDIFDRRPTCEDLKDDLNTDPCSANTWLSAENFRVRDDPVNIHGEKFSRESAGLPFDHIVQPALEAFGHFRLQIVTSTSASCSRSRTALRKFNAQPATGRNTPPAPRRRSPSRASTSFLRARRRSAPRPGQDLALRRTRRPGRAEPSRRCRGTP